MSEKFMARRRLHLLGVKILEERGKSLDARVNPGCNQHEHQQDDDDLTQSINLQLHQIRSDGNDLISPVRLAASAVLCLANTSLQTLLLTYQSITSTRCFCIDSCHNY